MGTGSRNFIGSTDFPSERSGTHLKKNSYMFFWRLAPLTVRIPLVQCFGMASTGNVPILLVRVLDWAFTIAQCVLCMYPLYSVLAWPARAM